MEEKPSEDILPIAEVYIKEEVIDDIKVEVQSEDENLDEFSPVEDHDDDSLIKPLKYETVCNSNGLSREIEERDDESSDEQNSNSALLQCAVCGKRYLTASSLSAHLSKQHRITLGPRYTCHICGALGQSKATLKRHLKRTHGADSVTTPEFLKKCRHCSQGQPTQEALYTHIATAHPEELEKYHCCPKCSALFSSRPSLIRHLGRIHPGVEFPEYDTKHCEKCGDGFKSSAALRKHLKENHPESLLHQCQKCKATFKYSYLLARHTKSAHRERTEKPVKLWHKCEFCEREYRTQSRMERHIKLLHINPQTRVFRCTVCDITFATNNLRVQHYRAVHRKRKQPNCSECSKSFETVDELLVHRQEHKIDCPFCNKQFVRRDTLREHLLIHTGPRLPCPYCSKTFTQSSNLKRHIRIHTGEKPYKCTFCSKRFGDKSACNSHIRVHTGAERCMCHICGASFSKRQKLNYHMRKHTGEGLLHCPLCTKPTTNSYALKKHMESHQQPLLKVLTNTGIASAAEDWHEITLKALHNLAQLAAQKCSELTAAREAKGKKIFESEDTKDVQNTNTDISREDSSPGAENFTSTFTDQKQIMRKSKLKTKTSQKGETGSDENSGRDSSTNHRETVLKNRESLDGDSSSEENCPIDLTSAKDYLHKNEEDELLERENSESLPDNEHEPSGSMALQGSPSDVLFHLLETIVESHYRTFQTTDVRPTLGDQLVEQCLEIMMLDDTSKIVGDDGKIDNTNTHSVFSCDSGARNDGDLSDASLNEDGNCVDTISKEEVESPEEEEEFDTASVQDIRDLPTTKIKKEEYFSSSLSTNSTNGMGLFQRELLGDDVNASSASLSSEASTDSEHISEALLNMENSPCEETEEARNLKQNEKRIKYKADGKKRKLTSKKSNANNDDKLLKKAKYNNKFNLKPKDIEDICEDSQAVPQLNLSPKRRSRRNCSSPSVNVSFKAYIHTNGWSDA